MDAVRQVRGRLEHLFRSVRGTHLLVIFALVYFFAAASLFLGGKIGPNFYLQSEIIKGIINEKDFGFALTVKFIS